MRTFIYELTAGASVTTEVTMLFMIYFEKESLPSKKKSKHILINDGTALK
jgi:hypothetical protein